MQQGSGRSSRWCPGNTAPTDRRDAPDAGYSFIEAVITVSLLAIVLVPLMTAVVTSVKSSRITFDAARVETVLLNAADQISRGGQSCDPNDYQMQAAASTTDVWNDASLVSVKVDHLSPAVAITDDATWVAGVACAPAVLLEDQIQRITITLTSPDGRITREMEVVKSNV